MELWIILSIGAGLWAGNKLARAILRYPTSPVPTPEENLDIPQTLPQPVDVRIAILALYTCPHCEQDGSRGVRPTPTPVLSRKGITTT